jgi:hypothetical protein
MKKILLFVLPLFLLFASCRKEISGPIADESQWLNKERAVVVSSDINCPYYVVETYGGYSVLKSWDGTIPYQGSVMYGDFSSWGVKTFYNRSERYMAHADVTEYWLGYYDALDEMDYQCSH